MRESLHAEPRNRGCTMSLDGTFCVSMADTILDFANVVLCQIAEPPALNVLQQTIELAVSVWNAHVLATPEWGQPQHLAELSRLVAISSSAQMLAAFQALSEVRQARFASDLRVVCEWQVTADERGRTRFDCMARLPASRAS
jgi:hypothetical protein